ncbi:MAG: hypothetical protein MI724_12690 [Spirochaetales bacterium]|nr:hypothetical protein [Spirochaetales bacterium]
MNRKVTYQIDEQILLDVREAVAAGHAKTMSELVETAIGTYLRQLRRREIRDDIRIAVRDPAFLRDVAEINREFAVTTNDGLDAEHG